MPQERRSVVDGPAEGFDRLRRMPADGDEEEAGQQVQGSRRLPEGDALECRHRTRVSREVDAADATGELPVRPPAQAQLRPRLNRDPEQSDRQGARAPVGGLLHQQPDYTTGCRSVELH